MMTTTVTGVELEETDHDDSDVEGDDTDGSGDDSGSLHIFFCHHCH